MSMDVYFDNAATTAVSDSVIDLMVKTMREDYANPSAKHTMGIAAERYVKEAASRIAATLKCSEGEIIFTSCGTESNNLALIGAALAHRRRGMHLITTGIEHASVYRPMDFLQEMGYEVSVLAVDRSGHIDLQQLKDMIRKDTILVSTMLVNNEIGAIEPVEEISKIIKSVNPDTLYHVDAIQAYGKMRIYPKRMGIDMLSVSGHKFHGPKGVGFLFLREGVRLKPIIYGGGQQKDMRSGTINVPGIAGMGLAAKEAYDCLDERTGHMRDVRNHIAQSVTGIPGVSVNSPTGDEGAPHIVSISVSGVRAEVLLHALEARGIYVSSGSACSSHHPGISGTLKGIGLKEELLDSTIRVSLDENNTMEQADYFADVLRQETENLRRFSRK